MTTTGWKWISQIEHEEGRSRQKLRERRFASFADRWGFTTREGPTGSGRALVFRLALLVPRGVSTSRLPREASRPEESAIRSRVWLQRLRRIRPLPSSSQSSEMFSLVESVIRKSVWGVVPFS